MKNRNVSLELLKTILNDEVKMQLKFDITGAKNLLAMLEASGKRVPEQPTYDGGNHL